MGKTLLVVWFGILVLLAFGTQLSPDSSAFWLAASTPMYQVVRFGLMLLLLLQIATNPPRNRVFRQASCVIALAVSVWALNATYINDMMFLDTLSLVGSSVAIAITALERSYTKVLSPKRTAAAA